MPFLAVIGWPELVGVFIVLIPIVIYLSAIPMGVYVARQRGRSGWIGAGFALVLSWLGVLIVAVLPKEESP